MSRVPIWGVPICAEGVQLYGQDKINGSTYKTKETNTMLLGRPCGVNQVGEVLQPTIHDRERSYSGVSIIPYSI